MDSLYRSFNTKKTNILRCGTVIFNKTLDKIVIILNRYSYQMGENKWGLPKGHLNKNEDFSVCAQRETKEETGLNISIERDSILIKISKTAYYPIILDESECVFNISDTYEIYKVEWMDIEKLKQMPKTNKNHELKRILNDSTLSRAKRIAQSNKVRLL